MRDVPAIDSTGLHALHELARSCKHDRTLLLLADVHAQPMFALARSDILEEIGEGNLFGNLDDALDHAREFLGLPAEPHPPEATPTVARETPTGTINRIA
jgi:SulP family sulfate permease